MHKKIIMTVISNYIKLLKNLDITSKLTLISHLSNSILDEQEKIERKKRFYACFGAIETEESADEMINNIRDARVFRDKEIVL